MRPDRRRVGQASSVSPWCRIPTRSQTVSTSPNSCEEKKTVFPSFFNRWMISRTFIRPIGSNPLVGSSKINKSGLLIKAWASPTRCCIPLEYVLMGRLRADSNSTNLIAELIRDSVSALGMPEELGIKAQKFLRGQEFVIIRQFGQITQTLAGNCFADIHAKDFCRTFGWRLQSQAIHSWSWSCQRHSAQEAEDLALGHCKTQALDGQFAFAPHVPGAIFHAQIFNFQDRFHFEFAPSNGLPAE